MTGRVTQARPWGVVAMMLWGVLLIVHPAASPAEIVDIAATGRYHLGDNDSKLDGHRLALMEAKRNALEKAGTYVESITEVKDFQLTRDDIRSYTAGIVAVSETSEPKWQMDGGNFTVTVTVDAHIDKDDVGKRIAALRTNKEATQQLRKARVDSKEQEHKVATLNRQLKKAKKGSPAAKKAQAARSNALAGIDAQTLLAQGVAAKNFSQKSWQKMSGYVNRNVNVRGCMPTKTSRGPSADMDAGLLVLAVPALALAIYKPQRRKSCTRKPGPDAHTESRPLLDQNTGDKRAEKESA